MKNRNSAHDLRTRTNVEIHLQLICALYPLNDYNFNLKKLF